MRILMLNYEYPPIGGGTGVACQRVLRELATRPELEIDLVTSGPGSAPTTERLGSRVTIYRLPVGKRDAHFWRPEEIARWTFRAWRKCRELVPKRGYHVSHAWGGWPSGIPAFSLRRRVPYIVALRGSDVPGYNARLRVLDDLVFKRVARAVWRGATTVGSVSTTLRDLAHRTLPGIPIEVIPNGIDTGRFTSGADPDSLKILFVGRLIERKGVNHLIDAFQGVLKAHPAAELLVAGDGPERAELERIARNHGCADRVSFLGHVDQQELPDVYRSAGVFALPSRREGMPNAMLEAMACGLPIVSTPEGSAELVRGNGVLVEWGRPHALRDAIDRYFSDPDLRREHGRRSRELAESMSWSAVASWYQRLYDAAAK